MASLPSTIPLERLVAVTETDTGIVYAITNRGDDVFIGGNFTALGTPTGRCRKFNTTSGALLTSLKVGGGLVNVALADGSGGYYLGGNFTRVGMDNNTGGSACQCLVHIKSDGTIDTNLLPTFSASAIVHALALSGTTLYIGGTFTTANGSARARLCAFSTTTGSLQSFNGQCGNTVHHLLVSGSLLYVAGAFTSAGGGTRNRLAAFALSDHSLDAFDPNVSGGSGIVYRMLIDGSLMYIGGAFTTVSGSARANIAALTLATGDDTTWNPSTNGDVRALARGTGNTLYIGGSFSTAGGSNRSRLAGLDVTVDTSNATAFNPGPNNTVQSLEIDGTDLYVGGNFTTISSATRRHAAKYNSSETLQDFNPDLWGGNVYGMAFPGTGVVLGGDFSTQSPTERLRFAVLDKAGAAWTLKSWAPEFDSDIRDMVRVGNLLYVVGAFIDVDGNGRDSGCCFNLDSQSLTTWDAGANNTIIKVAANADGSRIYFVGSFSNVKGSGRTRVACVSSANALVTWATDGLGGTAWSCRYNPADDYVYIGSSGFVGSTSYFIARLAGSGTGLGDNSWNPDELTVFGTAHDFTFNSQGVWIAGSFDEGALDARSFIALASSTDGTVLSWDANISRIGLQEGTALTFSPDGQTIFLMATPDAPPAGSDQLHVAAGYDTTSGALVWNPGVKSFATVGAFSVWAGSLVVGGDIDDTDGWLTGGLAIFDGGEAGGGTTVGAGIIYPGDRRSYKPFRLAEYLAEERRQRANSILGKVK